MTDGYLLSLRVFREAEGAEAFDLCAGRSKHVQRFIIHGVACDDFDK